MVIVKSKALDKQVAIDREIGRYGDPKQGPTVIVFAGIHGNEPSGIFALKHLFAVLENRKPVFKGFLTSIAGNKPALELGDELFEALLPPCRQLRIRLVERQPPHAVEGIRDINPHTNELRQLSVLSQPEPSSVEYQAVVAIDVEALVLPGDRSALGPHVVDLGEVVVGDTSAH